MRLEGKSKCVERDEHFQWTWSPTPKCHLQSGGLSPVVTLSNRQRLHSQHQLNINRSRLSGFWASSPSLWWCLFYTKKRLKKLKHLNSLGRAPWPHGQSTQSNKAVPLAYTCPSTQRLKHTVKQTCTSKPQRARMHGHTIGPLLRSESTWLQRHAFLNSGSFTLIKMAHHRV